MLKRIWPLLSGIMAITGAAHGQRKASVPNGLVRGPYLQVATETSIMVRWRTDVSCRSRVRFGAAAGKLDKLTDDSTLTTEHIVTLRNLTPHTRYYYSIGSFNDTLQGGADTYFYTLPEAGKESFYRIGVFGDCGNNSVNQRNVKNQFLQYLGEQYMDAWILLGDNAYYNGTDAEFQAKFFNIYKDDLLKRYPVYPSPGNHDYHDVDFPAATESAQRTHAIDYYKNFSMPTEAEAGGVPSHTQAFYSFDVGNVHFLSLDSYGKEANEYRLYDTLGPQVQWVKKDLEANANKGWVVAYWHHPPYTMGSHNSDTEDELVKIRENFIRILERYNVDLILCGHSHVYERSRLMEGNYGMETTFNAAKHNVSSSSALFDGSANSCPYIKDSLHGNGTVYVVSGSAGQLGGMEKSFPHDAMFYSNATDGGAAVLEVQGNRLDMKWICADGVQRDHFTMMKNVNKRSVVKAKRGESVTLTASYVTGNYHWSKSSETTKSITVKPTASKTVYTVTDDNGCLKDTIEVILEK
ncbi:3',5'-cyclic AMP phosphodiesterase CpdA [Filimonas lacunae]|uniref:3',5'-cyclic AMP phosphodiesterase CpdA n=1 Tax=Filimonas lacunae TaxID=477680 RepID=A0A173MDS3_9BACT|nr:metallophosphoesterase family protein [Filimonas lacunae]BAV05591.1 acid phosphatase [Filimonas lacunae]SIT29270.1 3',5'-cyclic AMP phosphodiesterase CpdA [Filimonas lacunae]